MVGKIHTSEAVLNGLLGEVLRTKHPLWRDHLAVEQTGHIEGQSALRPDLLISPPNRQPVVLETEFAPAATVEEDARARLGRGLGNTQDIIEQAIAVRIPATLRHAQSNLVDRIQDAEWAYCVLSGDPHSPDRWPAEGWLTGTVDDLTGCIEQAMISQRLIEEGMAVLEQGVRNAAAVIRSHVKMGYTDIDRNLGQVLQQAPGEQTDRMAMAILVNALIFHSLIAGTHGIPAIQQLQQDSSVILQRQLVTSWRRILEEVNYWPIFRVASDLLLTIPVRPAKQALGLLVRTAEQLSHQGLIARQDLMGRLFQNLIVDRKFLATFYTLPTSATLLAEMAVRRMEWNWQALDRYAEMRVADLSCGTGTLLAAAYHAVLSRYRRNAGDDRQVHQAMMEQAIIAADIMPAASHLCASQLSSAHPDVLYDRTRVYTMPYGINETMGTLIGSLDLIPKEQTQSVFPTGLRQVLGRAETEVRDLRLPHHSVDLVIMNPPFTRPTNHEGTEVPVPSFAGFQTSQDEQRAMSQRLKDICQRLPQPAGHGNAGLASNFIDLAHAKVKPGGTVALVLPIAVVQGNSWQAARNLWRDYYRDVTVITIATSGSTDRAFSADTGMAEALILATKKLPESTTDPEDVLFLNLWRRPATLMEAADIARLASTLPIDSSGGFLQVGDQRLGNYLRAPWSAGGCAALREPAIAQTMIRLSQGGLRIARYRSKQPVPMVPLSQLGSRGLVDRDIGALAPGKPPYRGPFRIGPLTPAASYPVLWSHHAKRERYLVVQPDRAGEVLPNCEDRAVSVWETATRLHFNRDFQLNSQSLAACLTPEPVIGGTAWPNYRLHQPSWEPFLVLWSNATLGLMSFWWAGSLQQQGRSRLTISALPQLRVFDPRVLTDEQLDQATDRFDAFQSRAFLPANEAYRDPVRQELDRVVLVDILHWPEDILEPVGHLRLQWCSEPSVHGGKSTRP